MKTVSVTIVGITPMLQHKFGAAAEVSGNTRAMKLNTETPRQAAESVAYIAEDGTHYFSAAAISRCMAAAGSNHKMRGSRKSLRFVVPSAVRLNTDTVTILDEAGTPMTKCDVDSRPVTIPATKGRIMRHRPRYEKWSASFDLVINDAVLDVSTAHTLLTEAGVGCGIGDFRPEKSGPFGQFRVVKWDESAK